MNKVYTVSQVTDYISGLFEQDVLLTRVTVRGEVSNCKYHGSGHIYFTLKDAGAAVSCVMFKSRVSSGLLFHMQEGDRVDVTGSFGVWKKGGNYQLYARKIERQGAGALYEQFLKLKRELEEMGMFDPMYKQPIPKYARTIGIVTAPTGAAVQDIRNIALRRNPYIQLILFPALVQGRGAKESIVRGIRALDRPDIDCIIVGRGGGSIEDLWAFNEREVAEAVFQCSTPVISAVGHETDFTIVDFVADRRAPTPSAAAELAVTEIRPVLDRIEQEYRRLQLGMDARVQSARSEVAKRTAKLTEFSPRNQIAERKSRLLRVSDRMTRGMQDTVREKRTRLFSVSGRISAGVREPVYQSRMYLERTRESLNRQMKEVFREYRARLDRLKTGIPIAEEAVVREKRHRLQMLIERMKGLSPLTKLNQGYARTEDVSGKAVTSVSDVKAGSLLRVYVRDGRIDAEVKETRRFGRNIPDEA